MILPEPCRPRSRPRALCLDLSGTERLPVPSPNPNRLALDREAPETFGGHLLWLATKTGLPTVVLSEEHLGGEAFDLLEALPGQIMLPKLPQRVIRSGSEQEKYELFLLRMGIEHEDLLCISNEEKELLRELGIRSCGLEAAVDWLTDQSVLARRGVISDAFPIKDETVHTAIVPLDLEIGASVDPLLLEELGYRTFDMVIMAEVFVSLEGFSAKLLQKLVSGFAPILNMPLIDDEEPIASFSEAMNRLWHAGCRRVIFVSQDGAAGLDRIGRFEVSAEFSGFDVDFLSWRDLIKAGGAVGYV